MQLPVKSLGSSLRPNTGLKASRRSPTVMAMAKPHVNAAATAPAPSASSEEHLILQKVGCESVCLDRTPTHPNTHTQSPLV